MRLNLIVRNAAGGILRWVLQKSPDGEQLTTALTDAAFHGSDDTQNQREVRKMTIAKGMILVAADKQGAQFRIFVSRKAWQRISPMRENDRLDLYLAKDGAGTSTTLDGFGTVWCRAN